MVNFDPKVQDPKSKLTRDPTPYPKELHVKALQWRAAREEAAAAHPPDKPPVTSDVPLRNNSRSRSVHRPYSLIRAMSDPIEPGDLTTSGGNSHPPSRRRDRSHERRETSQSPRVTPVMRDRRSSKGERPASYCSSPSPPPLAMPAYYSPGNSRHQTAEEAEWLLERQRNGTRGGAAGVPRYPSPTPATPGDEITLLASNSNSNNNNSNVRLVRVSPPPSSVSPGPRAGKSITYPPPSQPAAKSTSALPTSHRPGSGRGNLQTTPQAHSEASTLSHSDTPDPRYSSSLESGFDADMEQDQVLWYMTDTSPEQQQQAIRLHQLKCLPIQRTRHASDSSALREHASSAPRSIRRGSADDYDHLERCSRPPTGAYRQRYSSSCSPRGRNPPPHQLATQHQHHQKASRSFDMAELPGPPLAVGHMDAQPAAVKGPHSVSFTAAARGARNYHSRSRSDPDDLVPIEEATPISRHAHRSAKGSLSPTPLNHDYVNINVGGGFPRSPSHSRYTPAPLVSPLSNTTYHHLMGPGRKRGGAGHAPHQRYPSNDSHGRGGGVEPDEQATPKNPPKVNKLKSTINLY